MLAEAQGLWGTGLVGTADGLRGRTARAWRRLDRRSGLCVRVRSAQSVGSLFQLFSFSGVCYACGGVSWMHAHLDGQGTAWEGSWGPQLQASGRRRTARHRCCCSDEPRWRGRRPAAARATRKHMRRSASSVASAKTVPAVAAAARRWHRSAAGAGSTAAAVRTAWRDVPAAGRPARRREFFKKQQRADLLTAPRLGGFGQKLEGSDTSDTKIHFTTPATAPRWRSPAVAPPRTDT